MTIQQPAVHLTHHATPEPPRCPTCAKPNTSPPPNASIRPPQSANSEEVPPLNRDTRRAQQSEDAQAKRPRPHL